MGESERCAMLHHYGPMGLAKEGLVMVFFLSLLEGHGGDERLKRAECCREPIDELQNHK